MHEFEENFCALSFFLRTDNLASTISLAVALTRDKRSLPKFYLAYSYERHRNAFQGQSSLNEV